MNLLTSVACVHGSRGHVEHRLPLKLHAARSHTFCCQVWGQAVRFLTRRLSGMEEWIPNFPFAFDFIHLLLATSTCEQVVTASVALVAAEAALAVTELSPRVAKEMPCI